MMSKRAKRLLAGLVAGAALAPASAQAAYEWDIARPGSPPDGMRCTKTTGSKVCFEQTGDKIWVKDTRRDKKSALAKWQVPLDKREGYCRNRLTYPRWGYCNKNFSESASIEFWATRYDRETNSFPGPWSRSMLDRVANPSASTAAVAAAPTAPSKAGFVLRRGRVPQGTPLLSERIKQLDERLDKSGVQDLLAEANNNAAHSGRCIDSVFSDGLASNWYCFDSGDTSTHEWWPQGVTGVSDAQDDESWGASEALLVSSYDACSDVKREKHADCPAALPATMAPEKGARVSFLNTATGKYRHVLLVYPYIGKDGPTYHGVGAAKGESGTHAGGLVWYGNYLYVPESAHGVRVFDMRSIFDLGESKRGTTKDRTKVGLHGRTYHGFGYRYVMPQLESWVTGHTTTEGEVCQKDTGDITAPPRFSYASLDRSQVPDVLVTGEYCGGTTARLATWPLRGSANDPNKGRLMWSGDGRVHARHTAWLPDTNIQGAVGANGHWWFTKSSGEGNAGRLIHARWNGGASWADESATPTAIGPEDLYCWRGRSEVWSVAEWPDRRAIYAHSRSDCN